MQITVDLPETLRPGIDQIKIYFSQRGMSMTDAEYFFRFYDKKGWRNKRGHSLKNWKNTAYQWILKILKREPWRFNKNIH